MMITISDQLALQPITLEDQSDLFELMQRIYKPAYSHFWQDQGNWYLNAQYNSKNLKKELQEEGSYYYFVRSSLPARQVRKNTQTKEYNTIGILKIIENCIYPEQPDTPSFKVHRIYIDTSLQGKGIGKQLMRYAEERAQATKHHLIWLDAMDQHPQALGFYDKLGFAKGGVQYLDFDLLHDPYRPIWYLYKHLM